MDTKVKQVEVLPLIKYYMEALGLARVFDRYVPNRNGMEIDPSQVLCLMVMNIMVSAKPLYRVEDWLHDYRDGVTEQRFEAGKYNDDRLGRNLDVLFEADRPSLLAELSAQAIRGHELETAMHNDSTRVTLIGAYEADDPQAVKITHGYNKDHRPDCKQLVFGLNITEDGHVPLSYQLYDGNQADVTTHLPNWQALRELLGREDFIYVADSKLCAYENLNTLAEQGGQFITVVPRNFREVKRFLERVREGEEIPWQVDYAVPDTRKKGRTQIYRIHVGEHTAQGGYRILWIHSTAKERLERKSREQRVAKAEQALERLSSGLNQRSLKTREQIERAVKKATQGAAPYLSVILQEERILEQVQLGCGRPGPNTRYGQQEKIHYRLDWQRDESEICRAQRTDGLFPLVDNTDLEPIEVLRTYKNQPYLEKRFHTHKSVLEVAPVFLETPRRIEAMLFLYFIALMLVSLIERRIRREMRACNIDSLPMRPAGMHTKKPTWRTIVDSFHGVYLATIEQAGKTIHTALKGLSPLRQQILALLKVPTTIYTRLRDRWWLFALE